MSAAVAPSVLSFLFAKERDRAKRTVNDNRGAIMVLGIFMACVMIGFMWMLVGLGDAMIWRDRSQEAADALAYTSAAADAKAMNFISFLNLIMLLIAAIYLAMALIYNLLDFTLVLVGRTDDGPWLRPSSCEYRDGVKDFAAIALDETGIGEVLQAIDFCEVADIAQPLHDTVGKALRAYEKDVMWTILPLLSKAETFVAMAGPWVGAALGSMDAYKYTDWGKHRYGLPISSSMVPASVLPAPVKKWSAEDRKKPYTGRDGRQGLPVEPKEMGELCKVAADGILDTTLGFLKKIPGIGLIAKLMFGGIADAMEKDYCKKNAKGIFGSFDGWVAGLGHALSVWGTIAGKGPNPDHGIYHVEKNGKSIWEDPDGVGGPHEVVEYAENGNDWMQVWGGVLGANRPEQAQRKVGAVYAPALNSQAPSDTTVQGFLASLTTNFSFYFAQSEFYYDCDKKWTDEECNKNSLASYNLKWRARLRRVHGISWGKDMLGWFWNTSMGGDFDKWVKGGEQGDVKTLSESIHGFEGETAVNGAYDAVKGFAGQQVGGMINPASALPSVIH